MRIPLIKKIKTLTIVYVCFLTNLCFGQISPVSSYTVVHPPTPLKVSDLISSNMNKITLQIRLLDMSVQQAKLQLRMIIDGNGIKISSMHATNAPVFFIGGGENLSLSNSDLSYYFKSENLLIQGMQKNDFVKGGGRLPEGRYRIWFEVYEYTSGSKVSIQEIAADWLIQSHEPPILNYPQNQSTLFANDFQNLQFQWTPRHLSAVDGMFDTEYTLEIVQIPENYQGDWRTNFSDMPKFFVGRTSSPSFLYSVTHPPLQLGYFYAYRVKVRCRNTMQEEVYFRNKGYSEVYCFFYKENCPQPLGFTAKETGKHTALIQWTENPKIRTYSFLIRKLGLPDAEWFSEEVEEQNQLEIKDLEASTTYECKMTAQCLHSESLSTPLQYFTTLGEDSNTFWCGNHTEYTFSNRNPLYLLRRFDQVKTTSGFIVTIEEVVGENGIFTGTAYTYIPLLAKTGIKLKFSKIFVNENYELLDGEFVGITNLEKL